MVAVQSEAVRGVDVSAAQMFEQLGRELNGRGTHVAFVEQRTSLQDLVQRYGLFETIDGDRFYPTREQGLAAIGAEGDEQATPP